MNLDPAPTLTGSVLTNLPFTLPIDLQPRRIHHHMHRFLPRFPGNPDLQGFGAPRHMRMIRDVDVQPHQHHQGAGKALQGAIGQAKHHFHHQQRLNGGIRILERRTPLPVRGRSPIRLDKVPIEPHGQAAAFNQGSVVFRPIGQMVLRFSSRNVGTRVGRCRHDCSPKNASRGGLDRAKADFMHQRRLNPASPAGGRDQPSQGDCSMPWSMRNVDT